MKKTLFFVCLTHFCIAQNDKLNLNKINLGNGIMWNKYHFELFDSKQSINVLSTCNKTKKLKFGFAVADSMKENSDNKRLLLPTSKIASNNDVLAAVNAGFFDMKNGGAVDFVKLEGVVTDTVRQLKSFHSVAAVTIHKNKVKIIKGKSKPGWEYKLKESNVLLAGPILRLNNVKEKLPNNPFNDNRHPRTCLCITNNNRLLLITVDGRSTEAAGMNLAELEELTIYFNCKDAINFDGGGSTTMYVKGQPERGVVNYPSDNKLFDHAGERPVSNIFYIK